MDEAAYLDSDTGRVAQGDGWFVVNVGEGRLQRREDGRHAYWSPEPEDARFTHFGIGIDVLEPGQSNALYHREDVQEDFLVLGGECLLIVEEQERRLRAWDFVHCPPGVTHAFVGAGDGPCIILMVGARPSGVHYPVSDLARRHGVSASAPSDEPAEAYGAAGWPRAYLPERIAWPPA